MPRPRSWYSSEVSVEPVPQGRVRVAVVAVLVVEDGR